MMPARAAVGQPGRLRARTFLSWGSAQSIADPAPMGTSRTTCLEPSVRRQLLAQPRKAANTREIHWDVLRLTTFGGVRLVRGHDDLTGAPTQRRRLAILVILAV